MPWYEDAWRASYVASYTSEKAATKEVERALQHRWLVQGMAGTSGHARLGSAAAATLVLGPVGLLALGNRTKDKISFVFVRPAGYVAPPMPRSFGSKMFKWGAIAFGGLLVIMTIVNTLDPPSQRPIPTPRPTTMSAAATVAPTATAYQPQSADVAWWSGRPLSALEAEWGKGDTATVVKPGSSQSLPNGGTTVLFPKPWGMVTVLLEQDRIVGFFVDYDQRYYPESSQEMLRKLGLPTSYPPDERAPRALRWHSLSSFSVQLSLTADGKVTMATAVKVR